MVMVVGLIPYLDTHFIGLCVLRWLSASGEEIMNYDVIRDGLALRDKYWEDQWLIGQLHEWIDYLEIDDDLGL